MRRPLLPWERGVVLALLCVLALVVALSGIELVRTFVAPELYAGVIGGEGPPSESCAYRSMHAYRVSNALLAGLGLFAIALALPISAARRRLILLVPVVALIVSFRLWFEWLCTAN